jgi:hypothetical protein
VAWQRRTSRGWWGCHGRPAAGLTGGRLICHAWRACRAELRIRPHASHVTRAPAPSCNGSVASCRNGWRVLSGRIWRSAALGAVWLGVSDGGSCGATSAASVPDCRCRKRPQAGAKAGTVLSGENGCDLAAKAVRSRVVHQQASDERLDVVKILVPNPKLHDLPILSYPSADIFLRCSLHRCSRPAEARARSWSGLFLSKGKGTRCRRGR